jgi:AcrR family transcriptional regulator
VTGGADYEPSTERGRATRRAIVEAAEHVFLELSYDRASISEITRRAGVAQGTFYLYFPDKRAAFAELVRKLNHDMRRHIAETIAGLEDRLDMEREGLRAFFDYVSQHHSLYRVVREAEFVDVDLYNWHYRVLAEGYSAGLRRGAAAGQVRSDIEPETLAWILMGIAEFLGGRWIIGQGKPPPDYVFDDIMRFIESGLGRAGDPA